MSYDIYLDDPVTNEPIVLDAPHDMRGGTYCLDGESRAHLNVTYNYYVVLADKLARHPTDDDPEWLREDAARKGGMVRCVRALYGMTGAESIPILQDVIAQLGDDVDADYWKATEGNAKRALCQLLALARMRPDGVWSGD